MKRGGRYSIQDSPEGEYEPNAEPEVLKNLKGIKTLAGIEKFEADHFSIVLSDAIESVTTTQVFTSHDICQWHYNWLKELYAWAGSYRHVNMTKDGFMFAAVHRIQKLIADLDEKILPKYTPCVFDSEEAVIEALAIVHVELILIHPFREGNGRIARLLSSLMALQAGYPALNFTSMTKGQYQEEYFAAVRAGIQMDYEPMKVIFRRVACPPYEPPFYPG